MTKLSMAKRFIIVALAFYLVAGLVAAYSLHSINTRLRSQALNTLTALVSSTHQQIINNWLPDVIDDLSEWSQSSSVIKHTANLNEQVNKELDILDHSSQAYLKEIFQTPVTKGQISDYFIVNNKYLNLSASQSEAVNRTNFIARHYSQKFADVFKGENVFFSSPTTLDINEKNEPASPTNRAGLFLALPLRDANFNVIAALLVGLNPSKDFLKITQRERFWQSGETYIFDSNARLLTESRFNYQLVELGLLKPGQTSQFNIEIRLPEKQKTRTPKIQPPNYTLMAESALSGNSGSSFEAYLDYRGIPVFGAWIWDDYVGIGITTEVDEKEVLAAQRPIISTIVLVFLLTLFLSGLSLFILFRLQKENATALHNSQKELIVMLNNAAESVITFFPSGLIRSLNRNAEILFCCDQQSINQVYIERFLGKEFRPKLADLLASNLPPNGHVEPAITAQDINENEFSARLVVSQHLEKNEKYFSAAFYDLSKLHHMENRLIQLESAVSQSNASIVIVGLDGSIEYVNAAFCKRSGYSEQEAMGEKPSIVKSKNTDPSTYTELWHAITHGKHWQGEFCNQAKDGSLYWESAIISPIKDRQQVIKHFLAIQEDITERKNAEQKLNKSQALLQEAQRMAELGSWEWDVETDLYYCSDEMFRLMDMPVSNETTSFTKMIEKVHPDDRIEILEQRKKSFYMHLPYKVEYRLMLENGGERIIQAVAEVVRDEKGSPIKMLGIARDITQQKLMEENFQSHNKSLEKSRMAALSLMQDSNAQRKRAEKALSKLAKSQEDLESATEAAEAASEAKSRFLATMSHEIRTPMNGVVGMLDLLLQLGLNKDQKRLAKVAKSSALALLQIINDILDFSKIEAGKMTVESIPMSWSSIVEGTAELLADELTKKQLLLYCKVYPEASGKVLSDPVRIRQIVLNLLANAVKFTDSSEARQGVIQVSVNLKLNETDEQSYLVLSVQDNGIGIGDKQLEHLFTPFSQADETTHRKFGGTGLGLSICTKLSELLGGRIYCHSEQGKGSEFCVELPYLSVDQNSTLDNSNNLKDLEIVLVESDPVIDDFLELDLCYRQAKICRLAMDDLTHNSSNISPVDVVLINAEVSLEQQQKLLKLIAASQPNQDIRIVIMHASAKFDRSNVPTNSVSVDVNPFLPNKLYHAIEVAVGRASPEIEMQDIDQTMIRALPDFGQAEKQGLLVLIVEDNINNQEVLQRQVNLFGYVAMIANHGLEALDLMKKHQFGLIITDCNMPEMDGFELTKAIREMEQGSAHKIPIIAATANALAGESEKCLAAGMDDYVSKPVELKVIQNMLNHWLPQNPETPASSPKEPTKELDTPEKTINQNANAQSNPAIDLSLLKLYLGDERAVHQKFLTKYLNISRPSIKQLQESVESLDWENVSMLSHKLKSSSKAVGAVGLGNLFELLEATAKDKNEHDLVKFSDELYLEYQRVSDYISSVVNY